MMSSEIDAMLEMNRALSTTADLRQALRQLLEILARHPAVVRGSVNLSLPGQASLSVEGPLEAERADENGTLLCLTLAIRDRPLGALALEVRPEEPEARERTERFVWALAELISQAVEVRLLLGQVGDGGSLGDMVANYERSLLTSALRATRGNRAKAARLLDTTERIVGYRVRQYGIDCSEFK